MTKQAKAREYRELLDIQYQLVAQVSQLERGFTQEVPNRHEEYATLKKELKEIELQTAELCSEFDTEDFEHLFLELIE